MNRLARFATCTIAASAALALPATGRQQDQPPRPNIVVIMADDMGYSDLGCYGGEINTPNLDRLAAGGLRFSQFYNMARCCPTRAALLTGLYPHQAGVGAMTFDRGVPGYAGELNENCVTIPEVLGDADYETAMVGKWHLSLTKNSPRNAQWVSHQIDLGPFSDPASYPVGRGFDEHYGTIWGVVDFFDPFSLVKDAEPIEDVPEDFYYTDAINDHAVAFLEEYAGGERPLFLYVAHTAPHWPLHALPEDIERYEETYTVGWDAIRQRRYERLVEQGLIEPDEAILTPRIDKEKSWEDNPHKAWDARAMAVHAAMIDRMDQGIGRIIEKLDEMGELENTLILFLSDNGASPEVPARPGFDRPSHTRDGTEIVYPTDKQVLPGPQETFGAIGRMWANASNTPYRYWKKESFEGGICTPLIAHWPAGLGAEPGTITHQPGHVIDVMATCLELAGAEYPQQRNGRDITPLEGRSLLPVLRGEQRNGHEAIYFEHVGGRAVRRGDWKLVALSGAPWELYHLGEDRTEMRNVIDQFPQIASELEQMWEAWAQRANVVPRRPDGSE